MPATDRALEFARAHPELGFGVHLTLCADPLSPTACPTPRSSRASYGADGTLLSTREVRLKGDDWAGSCRSSSSGRSRPRCALVVDAGIPVSHVDSHRHLHKFQPVRRRARDRPAAARDPPRARGPGRLPEPAAGAARPTGSAAAGELARPRRSRPPSISSCRRSEQDPWSSTRVRARSQGMEGGLARDRRAPRALRRTWRDRDRASALELARSPSAVASRSSNWRTLDGRSDPLAMPRSVSVVIPARDAAETIGVCSRRLRRRSPPPAEVIVVDDASTRRDRGDRRAPRARRSCGSTQPRSFAGGARNRAGRRRAARWSSSSTPTSSRRRAGGQGSRGRSTSSRARSSAARGRSTARHARGAGSRTCRSRRPTCRAASRASVPFLSSFCLLVPRDAPLRWDESYGGEDALFCVPTRSRPACGSSSTRASRPRTSTSAETFGDLRRQQRRLVVRLARAPARSSSEPRHGVRSRACPLHYFALLRLPVVYRPDRRRPAPAGALPLAAAAARRRRVDARRERASATLRGRPALRGGPQPRFE